MGQGIDLVGSITRIVAERPPPPIDLARVRSVLIIKLSSVGDVVHALPVATALKRSAPLLRITWAVEAWTAPLVAGHPAIDRVVIFPAMVKWPSDRSLWIRDFRAAVRELRRESYNVAIDLQGLARSAVLSRLSRAALRIARAGQREGAHLISFGVPLPDARIHAVEEYLEVAKTLGAKTGPVSFSLPVSRDAARAVARMLAAHDVSPLARIIVVNPSASGRWKHWPFDRWVNVIDTLADAGTMVLAGASAQARAHAEIARRANRRPIDLTGQTTLAELVALLERASLHVAPDTGTVHIAAALETPVVAIYGPTRPWRVGPYGQPAGVVYHGERCGAGCPAYCVRGRACLDAATAGEVIEKARMSLADNSRRIPIAFTAADRRGEAAS